MEVIIQLILAIFLGALLGLEREIKRKEAGLKTYSLVALGACLFTIISFELSHLFLGKMGVTFDPSRIIQAIAIGVGFLGAGVIFHREIGIQGLTTAAGLWVSAAVGIAIGAQFYFLAVFGTFLALLVLAGFSTLEEKILKKE